MTFSKDDIRRALDDTITSTAVDMAKMLELDWACDMSEESRQVTKELARDVHQRIAERLGL